jgi:hypothetical protein
MFTSRATLKVQCGLEESTFCDEAGRDVAATTFFSGFALPLAPFEADDLS